MQAMSQPYLTTTSAACQAHVQRDIWRTMSAHKSQAMRVADILEATGYDAAAAAIRRCGNHVIMREYIDGHTEVANALYCRHRLCPMCSWRRSLKLSGNCRNAAITSTRNTGQQPQRKSRTPTGWRYLHLVLTLRNCTSYGLSDVLDQLQEAFTRLQRTKAYKDAIQGAYRSIEITRNLNRADPDYLTWHPHMHVLLVVHPSYLERHHKYITHDEWMQLWKRSARVPYGFREPELSCANFL